MSSQFIFNTTAAILTGLSPVTVNYTIPASALVEEEMEIETAQQFIDIFCSEKKMEWDEEAQEEKETLHLIEEINEDNYWIILEGYALFSTFDIEFQKEIQDWYTNPDLELDITYETLCTDALSFQEKIEKEESENEEVKDEAEKEESKNEEVKDETEKEEVKEEAVTLKAVETFTSQPVTMSLQPKTTAEVSNVKTNVLKKETSQTTKAFVRAYVSNSNGVIYGTATKENYRQIISGLSSWNKKSDTEKKEINEYLKTQTGKTYQTLLKEAQSVQFSVVNPSIPTATPSYYGFYGALCALSICLLGYFRSKYKQL